MPIKNTFAVMNTKGGVGKSTLVLALAETLATHHGKNVLVIDSDAQSSVSSMLMTVSNLFQLQNDGLTLVDFLVAKVLQNTSSDLRRFVVRDVSDVDDVNARRLSGTADRDPIRARQQGSRRRSAGRSGQRDEVVTDER